ncbi:Serine/Threonine kinase catalytic domain protein [Rhizoctonia solani AG-3 Rhs1AP]|uniref:Serine/Threonine kinase catalytic domain protein n=1 Tax=Rhizoctonia solani AG-3 Rhs1AP TaxID=1086054 RepID=X8J2L7_9AGAM|nr:Serine/Threonine kinase catalytic domain protein [Rhizoctonia solani AG-3 Rhs1AP]
MATQVHGDLKGANVLISRDGTPMLMDFGNANMKDATLQFTQTNTGPSYSLRWSPPEMLEGASLHTMAGDIYSLGMTILEALTAQIPFSGQSDQSLLLHIVIHRKIHIRPEKFIPTRSLDGDKLWAILRKCWSYDSKDRPSAEVVWNDMKPITSENLKELEGEYEASKDESGGKDKEGKV